MTSSPWTEALIQRFFGVQANARVSPQSSKKPSKSHLSQQPTPTAWSSSVSFRKLDVDFASRPRMELRSSHVNHQTSEMTNLILSRGDVALNKSGLGPLFFSFATQRDLMFGQSDVPFVSAQPFLEVFASLFPALAHGDLLIHRVLLYVRISSSRVFRTKIGSFFGIVPILSLSNRIQLLPGNMWAVREDA